MFPGIHQGEEMKTGLYSIAFTAAAGIGGLFLATEETGAFLWWAGLVIVAAAFAGIAVLIFAREIPAQPALPNEQPHDPYDYTRLGGQSAATWIERWPLELDGIEGLPDCPSTNPVPPCEPSPGPFEYISQMEAGKCLATILAKPSLRNPGASKAIAEENAALAQSISHEGWINVYRDRAGAIRFGWGFHTSLADAQKSRNHSLSATLESRMKSTVIARLRVAFAEGDGLEGPQLAPAAGSRMDE